MEDKWMDDIDISNTYTVKPVLRGHLREGQKVAT